MSEEIPGWSRIGLCEDQHIEVPQFNLRDYEPFSLECRELEMPPAWEAGILAEYAGDYRKAVRIFTDGRLFEEVLSVVEAHSVQDYAIQHLAEKAEVYRKIGRDVEACRFDALREMIESTADEITDIIFTDTQPAGTAYARQVAKELTDIEFIDDKAQSGDTEEVSERQSAAEVMVRNYVAAVVGQQKKGNGVNDARRQYITGGKAAEEIGEHAGAIDSYARGLAFKEAERVARQQGLQTRYLSTLKELAGLYAGIDRSKAELFENEIKMLSKPKI